MIGYVMAGWFLGLVTAYCVGWYLDYTGWDPDEDDDDANLGI